MTEDIGPVDFFGRAFGSTMGVEGGSSNIMIRKVIVVPHNPNWPELFKAEAGRLAAVLGRELVATHHIGSTAIPGIKAKPILDFLIEVNNIERVDGLNDDMVELGYVPRGEYGIPRRRFFTKDAGNTRTHHLHVFQTGNSEIERHLNFRDYMRAHPAEAQAYNRLKETLARKFPEDIEGYIRGKDAFIKEIDRRAALNYW